MLRWSHRLTVKTTFSEDELEQPPKFRIEHSAPSNLTVKTRPEHKQAEAKFFSELEQDASRAKYYDFVVGIVQFLYRMSQNDTTRPKELFDFPSHEALSSLFKKYVGQFSQLRYMYLLASIDPHKALAKLKSGIKKIVDIKNCYRDLLALSRASIEKYFAYTLESLQNGKNEPLDTYLSADTFFYFFPRYRVGLPATTQDKIEKILRLQLYYALRIHKENVCSPTICKTYVKSLINWGVDINSLCLVSNDDKTNWADKPFICIAAEMRDPYFLALFIKSGADVNDDRYMKCTPFALALASRNIANAELLLQHGATPTESQIRDYEQAIEKLMPVETQSSLKMVC